MSGTSASKIWTLTAADVWRQDQWNIVTSPEPDNGPANATPMLNSANDLVSEWNSVDKYAIRKKEVSVDRIDIAGTGLPVAGENDHWHQCRDHYSINSSVLSAYLWQPSKSEYENNQNVVNKLYSLGKTIYTRTGASTCTWYESSASRRCFRLYFWGLGPSKRSDLSTMSLLPHIPGLNVLGWAAWTRTFGGSANYSGISDYTAHTILINYHGDYIIGRANSHYSSREEGDCSACVACRLDLTKVLVTKPTS